MPAHFLSSPPLFGVLFAATLLAARGQDAPLQLSEALSRAAQRNPSLLAQAYAERAAEALIEQAGLRPNPTLDFSAENWVGTGALRGVRSLETTVQASQAFERGDKRRKRVTAASRDRDAAGYEFAARRAEILAVTASAFVDVLAAQQRLVLAGEPLKLAQEVAVSAESRVQAGAASPAEVARARAEVAVARGELLRAEAELFAARVRLTATWGGSAEEARNVAGVLRVGDALPSELDLVGKISAHPRLLWQRSLVEAGTAALDLERAHAVQDVTIGGGLRFLREGSDAAFVASLSIPLPVRNRNQGNIRAARETLAGAEQQVRAVEAGLRAAFQAAWLEVTAAYAAIRNLRGEALPAAEEAQAVVRRAYSEGQIPLIDVLDAQRALVALRRELLDLEAAFAAALARAEALVDSRIPLTTALISQP